MVIKYSKGKIRDCSLTGEERTNIRKKYTDQDFNIGVNFHAKMVGKLEVPQPNNRDEIVASTRRIRYEAKVNSRPKQRVNLCVSVDGIIVTLLNPKLNLKWWKNQRSVVYAHQIQRVFYVSHDAHDLQVFSYIVRDNVTEVYMCLTYKAYSKQDAIDIVTAIGQSFEICQDLLDGSLSNQTSDDIKQEAENVVLPGSPTNISLKQECVIPAPSQNPVIMKPIEDNYTDVQIMVNCSKDRTMSSLNNEDEDIQMSSKIEKHEHLLKLNEILYEQGNEIHDILSEIEEMQTSLEEEQIASLRTHETYKKMDAENKLIMYQLMNVTNRLCYLEQSFLITRNKQWNGNMIIIQTKNWLNDRRKKSKNWFLNNGEYIHLFDVGNTNTDVKGARKIIIDENGNL